MAGKLEATLVVRISSELKRELEKWAVKNHAKPGEMARKLLDTALGLDEMRWQLPPGIKPKSPVHGSAQKQP